ncbi:MAG TPA: hypothetical protein VKA70_10355 [Blastocatellia bacterium]|nr:hypothetical protein [Blastocatellia bacterium]
MKSSLGKMIGAYSLLAILVAALAGCAKTGEPEPAKNSAPETASAPAEPAKPLNSNLSPADAVTQAMRAQLAAKSYRVRINSPGSGVPGEILVEYVAPDRIHMTNPLSEMIAVGSQTYSRQGQGPWLKAPFDAGEMAKNFRDPKLVDQLTIIHDVKYLGQDTLDGAPMLVYEYMPKDPKQAARGGKTKVWISAVDSLPRKVETQGATNLSVTTILYSDYNSDIKIELPV